MAEPVATLPSKLRSLWPKFKNAYQVLRRWNHRGGVIFVSADEQALFAAEQVAHALGGRTVRLAETGVKKSEYEKDIGRYLDGTVLDGAARHAGMDRLCIIIPRIDKQAKWLRDKIKRYCERAPRPFVLLLTCPDLKWMPSHLEGHLYECRRKKASRAGRKSKAPQTPE